MRDLSEQEIKKLYESEYRNVPDVWDKVIDRIKRQEQAGFAGAFGDTVRGMGDAAGSKGDTARDMAEDTGADSEEEGVLHFARLGRKRWIKLGAALAACFVIVSAYVLQNGISKKGSDYLTNGGTEAALNKSDEGQSYTAVGGDELCDAAAEATEPADSADMDAESASEMQKGTGISENGVPDNNAAANTEAARINVNGIVYIYDASLTVTDAELKDMKYLGESVCVMNQTQPEAHLYVTGLAVTGRVYDSGTGEIYVLEDNTNQVYGFREQ